MITVRVLRTESRDHPLGRNCSNKFSEGKMLQLTLEVFRYRFFPVLRSNPVKHDTHCHVVQDPDYSFKTSSQDLDWQTVLGAPWEDLDKILTRNAKKNFGAQLSNILINLCT